MAIPPWPLYEDEVSNTPRRKIVSYIPPGTPVFFVRSDWEIEETTIHAVTITHGATRDDPSVRYMLASDDLWSAICPENHIYIRREDAEADLNQRKQRFSDGSLRQSDRAIEGRPPRPPSRDGNYIYQIKKGA